MAVSVSTEQGFALGQPQVLFEFAGLGSRTGLGLNYDVSADGQRFVTIVPAEDSDEQAAAPSAIRIVENWYEEFRDREQ